MIEDNRINKLGDKLLLIEGVAIATININKLMKTIKYFNYRTSIHIKSNFYFTFFLTSFNKNFYFSISNIIYKFLTSSYFVNKFLLKNILKLSAPLLGAGLAI